MSLFTDNSFTAIETSAFIGEVRTDIAENVDVKTDEYNFDFYSETPVTPVNPEKPPHFEWFDETGKMMKPMPAGRVSDASASTASTAQRAQEVGLARESLRQLPTEENEDEDLDEGAGKEVPRVSGGAGSKR